MAGKSRDGGKEAKGGAEGLKRGLEGHKPDWT